MEFDYVIVGAGSAGCALANRLSADPDRTVCLIEAGDKDTSPWIHIPVGYFKTMNNPAMDWCYETEPDEGIAGRSLSWPRGKVLGGSSSINGLLYVRGQKQDYDHWRQLGNVGWGFDDVLPCFKRSEGWEDGESELRGGDGPLKVSRSRLSRSIIDDWIKAAQKAGYPLNEDYNGVDQEGAGYFQMTMNSGWRCSAAVAYLKPIRDRSNLHVMTNSLTEHLLFCEGRVRGVRVRTDGVSQPIKARGEVILCAGAIGSPQILMLSGIGDADEIKSHGLENVKHLPGVGKNLQDHLQARPVYKCNASTMNTETSSFVKQAMIGIQFLATRRGPMTMAASLGVAFLKTRPELETPDIQFHIQPFSTDSFKEGPHKFNAFTASVCQLRPESSGEIRLKSSDPETHPAIHPNYLATQTDQQTIVDGIRIARKVSRLEPVGLSITEEYGPGEHIADEDYDGLLQWARETATTIYHPTGTCKMGPAGDKKSVVDSRLKVHGINGLRVADASIMPTIVSGNTNAPAIMIGERASDFIREDSKAASAGAVSGKRLRQQEGVPVASSP